MPVAGYLGTGRIWRRLRRLDALFPSASSFQGDIDLTSREIKTTNGGDIDLLAPGGELTVGINLPSGQASTRAFSPSTVATSTSSPR